MKTYNQLKKEFEKNVEKLQKQCPHKRTKWMDHWWALGHQSSYMVKVCLRCHKIIEKNNIHKSCEKKRTRLWHKGRNGKSNP